MKLLQLQLQAFGPFTGRTLDLAPAGQTLTLVHGPNEAGKSSTLRAIADLRFGIPHSSTDKFVHDYADLRIGGVFLDARGERHGLMRRKGRGNTLASVRFDTDPPTDEGPAPPDLVALLTGGLSREEHDAMFGLDHARLRAGGEALLQGEGEVGAALFEASAGVRSIAAVLAKLDQEARAFHMPGTRGRKARINEALLAYQEQQSAFRQATVRPSHWTELSRALKTAEDELAALESQRAQLHAQRLSIEERRAVAPLLRSHDDASALLATLADVPLLPADAATTRAAADAALSAARLRANAAAIEANRLREHLATLHPDARVLAAAAAIGRFRAAVETIETHRTALARAAADVQACDARVTVLARQIDATTDASVVIDRAPAPAARADIEARLAGVVDADRALEQHRDALERLAADDTEADAPALPSAESRTALRSALAEVDRSDATLRRLDALPATIAASERAVAAALRAIGFDDASGAAHPRPMLDATIDDTQRRLDEHAKQCDRIESRIADVDAKLAAAMLERDRLLASGDVPTPDALAAARTARDATWAEVRRTFIDAPRSPDSTDPRLPDAYADAVREADRIADALGRDAERAAKLQAALHAITKLGDERTELLQQRDRVQRDEGECRAAWSVALADAHLPDLSPTALREWQVRLASVRGAIETLQVVRDEQVQADAGVRALTAMLRTAIVATGCATPPDDASVRTLAAHATSIEDDLRQREKTLDTAAGQRRERDRQRQLLLDRSAVLAQTKDDADAALRPVLAQLLLPSTATVVVARTRLDEFVALLDARAQLDAAQLAETHARNAIAALERQATTLADALGEAPPADLRLYADHVATRLDAATKAQQAHDLATQALVTAESDHREHEATALDATTRLAALCTAASVASVAELPEAEARSQQRRDAESAVARERAQLAEASRRPLGELRALLRDHDAVALEAEEAKCVRELEAIDERLKAARERETTARRELDAIDGADTAARAREEMERAEAAVRADLDPWRRSRLAHALLAEALKRFRERAQGPMLTGASAYFRRMTGDVFVKLESDESDVQPVLLAERADGSRIGVDAMSEGTRDQLYLALRLAALDLRRAGGTDLPLILDDVLMTSDDARAARMLQALADFSKASQVIVFTHHAHLVEVARAAVDAGTLAVLTL